MRPCRTYAPGADSRRTLADLFAHARMFGLRPRDSADEFARLVSGVLDHPSCPGSLFDAIADELTNMMRVDWTKPVYVWQAITDDARMRAESEATR